MIGQVATLRRRSVDLAELHREIGEGGHAILAERLAEERAEPAPAPSPRPPTSRSSASAALLPGAEDAAEFWENILDRHHAIGRSRRTAGIGGSISTRTAASRTRSIRAGAAFSTTCCSIRSRYGIPPRSIEALDPLQLMTLDVVRRCLADAGLRASTAFARAHVDHHRRQRRRRRCRRAIRACAPNCRASPAS